MKRQMIYTHALIGGGVIYKKGHMFYVRMFTYEELEIDLKVYLN